MQIGQKDESIFDRLQIIDYIVEVCSVCGYRAECKDIFDLDYNGQNVGVLFSDCTKTEALYDDSAYFMCFTCIGKLLNAYDFIKQCEKSWYLKKRPRRSFNNNRQCRRTDARMSIENERPFVKEIIEIDEAVVSSEEEVLPDREGIGSIAAGTLSIGYQNIEPFDIEDHHEIILSGIKEEEMLVEVEGDESQVDPLKEVSPTKDMGATWENYTGKNHVKKMEIDMEVAVMVTETARKGIKPILKRKQITLEEKISILDRLKSGEKPAAVARTLNLNESTIRTIKQSEHKIRESIIAGSSTSAKRVARVRDILIEKMEKFLMIWIEDCIQKKISLDGNLIKHKALKIYTHLKQLDQDSSKENSQHDFCASKGWFKNFKKRFPLQQQT